MNNRTLGISMIAIATSIALWGEASALRVEVQAPPSTAPAPTTVQEVPAIWPPQLGKPYPELTLSNYDGTQVKLSDFKGKVVIIEPIGMTCPACNAFAGGSTLGTMQGVERGNMPSFEEDFKREVNNASFDDPNIIHISLLLYNLSMQGPRVEDAQVWAEHFKLAGRTNHYVLAGGPKLVNTASYAMIPGFQLLDKNGVLRSDASGHNPHDSLRALLLMVPTLLKEPQQ